MKKQLLLSWLGWLLAGVVMAQTPGSVAIRVVNSTQLCLSWTNTSARVSGNEIWRSTDNRTFAKIADVGATVTEYCNTGLSPSTRYYYYVKALVPGTAGFSSATVDAQTTATPPVVGDLRAAATGTTSIQLSWTDVGKEGTYYVERRTGQNGAFARIATSGAGYTDNNLSPGTEYCYRVQYQATGEVGGFSNVACATTQQAVPAAPARLTAQAVSSSQVNLSWADGSGNETGFQVERSGSAGGPFSKITDLPANTTTFSDGGLTGSTQYCYRVRAVNGAGASGYTDVVCVTTPAPPVPPPAAPSGLAATAVSASQINLSWTDNAGNETGFELERSTDGNTFGKIADLPANTTSFQNTGLNANTRYVYRLRAVNGGGASAYSNTAEATTADLPPAAPARLTAQAVSFSQVNLSWADQSGNEAGFQVERGSAAGGAFIKIADLPANTTSYSDGGLNGSTQYCYRIRAVNGIGASGYTEVVCVTTPAPPVPPPAAPSNLAATAVSASQINLSWTDNATTETGFELERSLDGTSFTKVADLAANATSFQNTGLAPNTRYTYRLRAVNGGGASAYSNTASATTPDVPPAAPSNLTAQAVSFAQINLSWSDHAGNETGYQVEQSTDGQTFAKVADLPANATTYQQTGLSGSTRYFFRVRAVNAIGPSGYSNVAEATTAPAPVPGAPTNLRAEVLDFERIQLSWNPLAANATGVVIERSLSPSTGFTVIGQQAAGPTTFIDLSILDLTTYYYRIRATNGAGSSPYSNLARVTPDDIITALEPSAAGYQPIAFSGRQLSVRLPKPPAGSATVGVISLQGAMQLATTQAGAVGQYDLSALPAGMYVVRVEAERRRFTLKIMVR